MLQSNIILERHLILMPHITHSKRLFDVTKTNWTDCCVCLHSMIILQRVCLWPSRKSRIQKPPQLDTAKKLKKTTFIKPNDLFWKVFISSILFRNTFLFRPLPSHAKVNSTTPSKKFRRPVQLKPQISYYFGYIVLGWNLKVPSIIICYDFSHE